MNKAANISADNTTGKRHFWFGSWLDDSELDTWLNKPADNGPSLLEQHLVRVMPTPFPFADFMQACDAIASALRPGNPFYEKCRNIVLRTSTANEADDLLKVISTTLASNAIREKIRCELGVLQPAILSRRYPERQFEAWLPIGCVTHVMPANVFAAPILGLIESLMVGNLNLVKISARDTELTPIFAEELCRLDPGGKLRDFIAITRLASKETERMQRLFAVADAISVWGGETAVAAVRQAAPAGVRVITWGHKISFAYIAAEVSEETGFLAETVSAVANDVCRLDQQACSSPQTILVETDKNPQAARDFAVKLAQTLEKVSPAITAQLPTDSEQAEITTVASVVQAEQALGLTEIFADSDDNRWRVFYDTRPGLKPSPLYRTIWVSPIKRSDITATLRPMRVWLQTCGLACSLPSLSALSRALFAAGVTRISRPGEMLDSYAGAPHDGVYALQQLTRRVSLDGPAAADGVGSLVEFELKPKLAPPTGPILDKAAFIKLAATVGRPDLVVKSGGSTGAPVYSLYSWTDYHEQMLWTAHGMVAAGLDPAKDRVINCYLAGYLYGSLISFWTILETLRVPQLPMAMVDDFDYVVEVIEKQRPNTILGMPSYILSLFTKHQKRLKGKIEKVFYGGEKLTAAQHNFLTETCGVSIVRSAIYGSNDAGPMGYQCPHCVGGQHHLLSALHKLEIVDLIEDKPVPVGEVGRLILTPLVREYPKVNRYEIGDTGRWLAEPCPCGRTDPRFELVGRTGDLFKVTGIFLNYRRFVDLLETKLNYEGLLQIHLKEEERVAVLEVWISQPSNGVDAKTVEEILLENYPDLTFGRNMGSTLIVRVRIVEDKDFVRNKASGKLTPVCDQRKVKQ